MLPRRPACSLLKRTPPVPGPLVYQGYACPYFIRLFQLLDKHGGRKHKEQDSNYCPGPALCCRATGPAGYPVPCQRLYITRAVSHIFEVSRTIPAGAPKAKSITQPLAQDRAELIRARVDQALWEGEAVAELADGQVPVLPDAYPYCKVRGWFRQPLPGLQPRRELSYGTFRPSIFEAIEGLSHRSSSHLG